MRYAHSDSCAPVTSTLYGIMSVRALHNAFVAGIKREFAGWQYVASQRHLRRSFPGGSWLVHFAFVNHPRDFDVVVDVAVQFSANGSLCIVGASLGNIEGIGQVRYNVTSEAEASASAAKAAAHFHSVGLAFLQHYSEPANVLACLKQGGPNARLISPLEQLHGQQIAVLESLSHAV